MCEHGHVGSYDEFHDYLADKGRCRPTVNGCVPHGKVRLIELSGGRDLNRS
jgi:hypothetical protein